MCGIAGLFSLESAPDAAKMEVQAGLMADALFTRGPDDRGVWVEASGSIALAHRRLSIIDLTPEGHQPMVSASGRYVVVFNGEIYNYRELREQLEYPWRGQSDTEVLLAAIESWGIEKALPTFNGMFAFAIWDRQKQTLTLARDRMGEKPLYYGWHGTHFVFASELKAFRTLPEWAPAIDRDALQLYMRYRYVPTPHSIYQGIQKLMPGCLLSIRDGQEMALQKPYWMFEELVAENSARRTTANEMEATSQLDALLRSAVKQRMISDVPLGAFLSGGIDSSTIVALMQVQSVQKVRTFTVGFNERDYNEAPYAKAVAQHLGTDHTEMVLSPREVEDIIPLLPEIYDEPFADSSQIPTYLVSRFARQQVTVALSGDGGDEMFGGYNRYLQGPALWNALSLLPAPLRKLAAATLPSLGGRAGFYAGKIDASSRQEFYRKLCSANDHPEHIVLQGHEPALPQTGNYTLPFAEWMMMQDALGYFPGDIMTKVDRAAMSVSLETRTPFTDPEVMAFAWRLPLKMKIRNGKGKIMLRHVLHRYVPQKLIERPKAGFAMPIGEWLRGPLKHWAQQLLSPETIRRQGYLNAEAVEAMWNKHQAGQDMQEGLWTILMFQAWLQHS